MGEVGKGEIKANSIGNGSNEIVKNYNTFKRLVENSYQPHGGEWEMLFKYIENLQAQINNLKQGNNLSEQVEQGGKRTRRTRRGR